MAPRPTEKPLATSIDLGDRTAPLTTRVNRRARRLIVTVDAVAGRVIVTAPSRRALPEAIDFARTRAFWIKSQLTEESAAKPFRDGAIFPLRGEPTKVILAGGPRAAVGHADGKLIVGGAPEHLNRRVADWLKGQARRDFTERTDHYARLLGRKRGPISIRDTRSRWGSCGPDGSLSYSWRLILAPPAMLDYVAAHECAHLVHHNHSPAYWRVLRGLGVDARAARDWFSAHGHALYGYGVEAG